MERLENKGFFPVSCASSDIGAQNDAGTNGQIGTNLTQPGSADVLSSIYFIQAGDFIKIGVSTSPLRRLEALQTSNPLDLNLLGDFPGDASDEFKLHCKFAKFHVRGEWFRAHPEILYYVADRRIQKRVRRKPLRRRSTKRDWMWL